MFSLPGDTVYHFLITFSITFTMLRFHFRFAIGSRIGTHPPGEEQGFGISTQEFSERTARAGKRNTGRNLAFKKKIIFVYVVHRVFMLQVLNGTVFNR